MKQPRLLLDEANPSAHTVTEIARSESPTGTETVSRAGRDAAADRLSPSLSGMHGEHRFSVQAGLDLGAVSDTTDPVHPDLERSRGSCLVSFHNEPGAIVVDLVGTLSSDSAVEVKALIDEQIGRAAGRLVILDLDGLRLVDEAAYSVAADADVRARRAGTRLRLIASADEVKRALRSAGFNDGIPVCDSYIEALTYREG